MHQLRFAHARQLLLAGVAVKEIIRVERDDPPVGVDDVDAGFFDATGGGGWGPEVTVAPFVKRLGRVGDAELKSLYANAECLALPSLHEGFGLPALEAMAAGTPVVAANTGALPEITGGAAILVDPLSPESIATLPTTSSPNTTGTSRSTPSGNSA